MSVESQCEEKKNEGQGYQAIRTNLFQSPEPQFSQNRTLISKVGLSTANKVD